MVAMLVSISVVLAGSENTRNVTGGAMRKVLQLYCVLRDICSPHHRPEHQQIGSDRVGET